ncbi:hypothetical protein BT69DRAFT_1281641, partial [Atractiella rhizophila]
MALQFRYFTSLSRMEDSYLSHIRTKLRNFEDEFQHQQINCSDVVRNKDNFDHISL